jgi:hypothetical protein
VAGDPTTDEGGEEDNDNNDSTNGDDQGMEELEHGMSPDNKNPSGGKINEAGKSNQGANGSGQSVDRCLLTFLMQLHKRTKLSM